MNTNTRLSAKEQEVLATIIETYHCNLLRETFRADNAEQDDVEVAVQRRVLESVMDKMGLPVRARVA